MEKLREEIARIIRTKTEIYYPIDSSPISEYEVADDILSLIRQHLELPEDEPDWAGARHHPELDEPSEDKND